MQWDGEVKWRPWSFENHSKSLKLAFMQSKCAFMRTIINKIYQKTQTYARKNKHTIGRPHWLHHPITFDMDTFWNVNSSLEWRVLSNGWMMNPFGFDLIFFFFVAIQSFTYRHIATANHIKFYYYYVQNFALSDYYPLYKVHWTCDVYIWWLSHIYIYYVCMYERTHERDHIMFQQNRMAFSYLTSEWQ